MSQSVELVEVGPRDGLQNEPILLETKAKISLINLLSKCGFKRIEIGSFVSSKWVPQMADSGLVFDGITRNHKVSYAALVPNIFGYSLARKHKVDEIAIFCSASESFSKSNLNASIQESFSRFREVMSLAKTDSLRVRGYVSCVTDCPYEGKINPVVVSKVARQLSDLGCYEISLGETLGKGNPDQVEKMLINVLDEIPVNKIAAHFHDTNGQALKNIGVALELGVRVFDSAVAGLGGCPFAPGSPGNVATESLLKYVEGKGYETGLDIEQVIKAANLARGICNI